MGDYLKNDLKKVIREGKAVVFIGSGVSIAATEGKEPTASWTGLLKNGLEYAKNIGAQTNERSLQRALEDIESDNLIDLLSGTNKVKQWINAQGSGEYRRWLREAVGSIKARSTELIQNIAAWGLPLVTTNYDGLLEEVTGLRPVTWRQAAKAQRAVRGIDRSYIFHLHGFWDEPDSVILDPADYARMVGDEFSQNLLRALGSLKSIIYIGCGEGLKDPNFGAFRKWAANLFEDSELRHYRLCRAGELEALRQVHAAGERVSLVPFGDEHGDLPGFIASLIAENEEEDSHPEPVKLAVNLDYRATLPTCPAIFGRNALLEDTVELLLADPSRPIPIRGGLGVGKTNLGLNVLHHEKIAEHFGKNRIYIPCDAIQTPENILIAIAEALKLEISDKTENLVFRVLSEGRHLVVLDNFETPYQYDRDAAEQFLNALYTWGDISLVVGIRGREKPAGLPWRDAIELHPLPEEPARKLFLSIAGPEHAEDPDLDYLMQRMDGLPIAIRLLAFEADGLPDLYGLRVRWDQFRTQLLQQRKDNREFNLATSIELSVHSASLDDAARCMLYLICYLPEGFARADCEGCFAAEGLSSVAKLRKAGLLLNDPGRLNVLAPIREYIVSVYPPCPEEKDKAEKHFLEMAEAWGPKVGTPEGSAANEKLAQEFANIKKLLLDALDEKRGGKAALAMAEFFRFSGSRKTEILEKALNVEREREPKRAADILQSLGKIAFRSSDNAKARDLFGRAIAMYQRVGDPLGEANSIQSLGKIAFRSSDNAKARDLFGRAIAMYQR
ncbi:MAG: SIR2 family protein, partial [Bacteroidota bacterium]